MMKLATAILATAALASGGCAMDFTEYTDVDGLRVLAVRSSPPQPSPGQSATLDALVTDDATYRWRWCPVPYSSPEFECGIAENELRALVAAAGEDPDDVPGYELGEGASATLPYPLPPDLLRALCEQAEDAELPPGVPPFSCDGRFDIGIRVDVAAAGQTVATVRELTLIYDDELEGNANPRIDGGELAVRGAPPFSLGGAEPTRVARDVAYTVELDVAEEVAESYTVIEPGPDGTDEERVETETLIVTWFYDAGDIDRERTSFIDGVTDFDNLRTNEYRTPTTEESAQERVRLYFVLRDDRGGIDWFVAELELGL